MGRRGRSTITNRITQYFDEDDPRQEAYEEYCEDAWRGVLNHTLEIWFGECPRVGVEDFLFREVGSN